ncbi:glycosyltransferase family 4 protein [Mucilaginibacter sp.]|uniref:glycosyltransferase family 4 protein n=1 Tax=Mucilaginibacter sp. TaxID=1882438 RepID=UPI003D0E11DF
MKCSQETLVILTPGFPKDEADTTCVPPQQIFVRALKQVCPGLNVIVLTFEYPFHTAEYEWHGIRVIPIGGRDKGRLFRLRTWQKAWLILSKLNKENQLLGLLSFWMGECALVGDKFAKQKKLTHYTWLLGQDAKKGNKYFKWIKPKGDSLIALSDFLAREIKQNYKITPAHIIPVGVDRAMFGTAPVKRDIDILGAGSLIPLKQYHLFVEAIALLKEIFPNIKAVICGKGPEMQQLQTMTMEKGLSANLLFVGEVAHTEVLALMQRSKIFLHPSNYEGFGAVLSEAFYAGAQVVSLTKPMNKDYRHHYVVKDMDEMITIILSILRSKKIDHEPVLICPVEQIAKNMISLFVD